MPSPGKTAIEKELAKLTYTVEGGFPVKFIQSGYLVQNLSTALNTGWTSASPTTITTMATAISQQFNTFRGQGLTFVIALGTGIDTETAKWAASFKPLPNIHSYAPTVQSTIAAILAASPIQSAGIIALTNAVATLFIDNFEQEIG